ncbi:MAG TPA: alkaline phosphatase family protein [Terriglobales bacterium]|nr:alkaline phosphatase family protein [Terriglobales bacterium]
MQHVIVVIMQNNSFDHLFGMFPPANGNTVNGLNPNDPGYVQTDKAGAAVSPFLFVGLTPNFPEGWDNYRLDWDNGLMDKFAWNGGDAAMGYFDNSTQGMSTLWNWANQYALADNYFSSSFGEAPTNQLYMVAAQDLDRTYSVQPYYDACKSDTDAKPYEFPNLGEQMTQAGISWAVYQENFKDCSQANPEHNPFLYLTNTYNAPNLQDYTNFAPALQDGTLPAVSFVIPNSAHDLHPGFDEPVQTGVTFLENLVQAVKSSSAWPSTAIVITFDTAGGWYDHVPPPSVDDQGLGFRVPTIVISQYAKQGYVSHVQMDDVSILNFIQWNWNLPKLSEVEARQKQSNNMLDMFQGLQ